MAKKNKLCLLLTAICLSVSAVPSYAWQAARGAYGGAAFRGDYGGAAVRAPNGAVAVRTPAGNVAYRPPTTGFYHAPVPAYGYRPPVYYGGNYGYSSGQVAAAGVAGLAVGAMVGSAASQSSTSTTTVVQAAPAPSAIAIGTNLNSLPGNCQTVFINSIQYFQCGSSWLRQYTGYFQVVPAPY